MHWSSFTVKQIYVFVCPLSLSMVVSIILVSWMEYFSLKRSLNDSSILDLLANMFEPSKHNASLCWTTSLHTLTLRYWVKVLSRSDIPKTNQNSDHRFVFDLVSIKIIGRRCKATCFLVAFLTYFCNSF